MGILLLNDDGTEFAIDKIKFVKKHSAFVAKDKAKNEILFYYPLQKSDNTPPEDFDVFLFYKPNLAANNIFQITDKNLTELSCKGKLGWIFPIQSFLTNEHDYSKNPYFLPYAYNAYLKLLDGISDVNYYNKIKINEISDGTYIEKIYGENTIVMILYKNYLNDYAIKYNQPFDIKNYIVDFYSKGFNLFSQNNFNLFYHVDFNTKNIEKEYIPSGNKINIQKVSNDFIDNEYVNNLLLDLIPFQDHPLVKFHLLYQIIELLIDLIFKNELTISTSRFKDPNENFHDIKDEIMTLTKEQERIVKLFNDYSKNVDSSLKKNLKATCDLLIGLTKDKIPNDAPKSLYKVRCLLFHNLRSFKTDYTTSLKSINSDFENLLTEILIEFKLIKI